MKLKRTAFEEKFEEVAEKLIEANAEMNQLMHKPPNRRVFRASLREALTVKKCLCGRPQCLGWVVRKKK